jgi:hypothetical protein
MRPPTAEEIEQERNHVIERINFILLEIADEEGKYSNVEKTALMNRLEGYFFWLFKLPASSNDEILLIQEELCMQFEGLLVADLQELKKPVKFVSGLLRRHRQRVRRHQAANH